VVSDPRRRHLEVGRYFIIDDLRAIDQSSMLFASVSGLPVIHANRFTPKTPFRVSRQYSLPAYSGYIYTDGRLSLHGRVLECCRRSEDGRIGEASAHDLKTHGQPLASKSARNGTSLPQNFRPS
jgi:hypothetical protein